MHQTIEALLKGDEEILHFYKVATERWTQVLMSLEGKPEMLKEIIRVEQFWFERNCGGRELGQEIMVLSGIARYYDTHSGFTDQAIGQSSRAEALNVYRAFVGGNCSIEVKFCAEMVGRFYDLELGRRPAGEDWIC